MLINVPPEIFIYFHEFVINISIIYFSIWTLNNYIIKINIFSHHTCHEMFEFTLHEILSTKQLLIRIPNIIIEPAYHREGTSAHYLFVFYPSLRDELF